MPIKILMVCLGNICRSPLAQGLLASKLPSDRFLVDSAGTGNSHVNYPPDERSVAVANRNGLDISAQRGRQISVADFDAFDYIFVMDASNYDDVMDLAKTEDHKAKVSMLLNHLFPGENVDVPDPYYGMANGFTNVYGMIDQACEAAAKNLLEKYPN